MNHLNLNLPHVIERTLYYCVRWHPTNDLAELAQYARVMTRAAIPAVSRAILRRCPDALHMDKMSAEGNTNVLDMWKQSGLPLTYTAAAITGAEDALHFHVLDWWRDSGLPLLVDPDNSPTAASTIGLRAFEHLPSPPTVEPADAQVLERTDDLMSGKSGPFFDIQPGRLTEAGINTLNVAFTSPTQRVKSLGFNRVNMSVDLMRKLQLPASVHQMVFTFFRHNDADAPDYDYASSPRLPETVTEVFFLQSRMEPQGVVPLRSVLPPGIKSLRIVNYDLSKIGDGADLLKDLPASLTTLALDESRLLRPDAPAPAPAPEPEAPAKGKTRARTPRIKGKGRAAVARSRSANRRAAQMAMTSNTASSSSGASGYVTGSDTEEEMVTATATSAASAVTLTGPPPAPLLAYLAPAIPPGLHTLSLRKLGLTAADMAVLLPALPEPFITLDLSENAFGDEGGVVMAPLLPRTLRALVLEKCKMGDKAVAELAANLPPKLLRFSLSEVQRVDLVPIRNLLLALGVAKVRRIAVARCGLNDDDMAVALDWLSAKLADLDLTGNPITDASVDALAKFGGPGTTDPFAFNLSLRLDHTKITEEGAAELKEKCGSMNVSTRHY
ncbi:hypothetical protein H9P43_003067 [Blastocladiella emersonii ATCC 22665]|nr:hypothetical protein H9P43_003067 [Blastocladiella emersonii ATCC 22665]